MHRSTALSVYVTLDAVLVEPGGVPFRPGDCFDDP